MASYAKYGGGGVRTFLAGLLTDAITSATAVSLVLKSAVADGAAAVGLAIDTANALVTVGAKIASIRNGGVEQLYIGLDGSLMPAADFGPGLGAPGNSFVVVCAQDLKMDGAIYGLDGQQRIQVQSGNSGNVYFGTKADGAGAIGHQFRTSVSYSATGARLASVCNGSAEKWAVHKDGKTIQSYSSSAGSPGAATNNNPTGRAAIASGASSVVITNSTVTAASIVKVQLETSAVGVSNLSVVPAAGSFTVTALNGTGVATNVTGNATFSFVVSNL